MNQGLLFADGVAWDFVGQWLAEFIAWPLSQRLMVLYLLGIPLGAIINAAIYRLAYLQPAIGPWSRRHEKVPPRRWHDFFPIVGWWSLRRESEVHRRGYWIRPLAIELLLGAAIAALYWWEIDQRGLLLPRPPHEVLLAPGIVLAMHAGFLSHLLLLLLLLIATCIDLDEWSIPDAVTVPGTLAALILLPLLPWANLSDEPWGLIRGYRPPHAPDFPTPMLERIESAHQINFLKATSPAEWPGWLNGLMDDAPLWIALAIVGLWCFSLLPRTWRGRHGWERAVELIVARILREPYSAVIVVIGVLAGMWVWMQYQLGPPQWEAMFSSLVGLAVGAGMIWWVRIAGARTMLREAMGFGDVTLMAMIGAFLGWQPAVMVFAIAPVLALFYVVLAIIFRLGQMLPFGPFLCGATMIVIAAWPELWHWAAPLFGGAFEPIGVPRGWFIPMLLAVCGVLLPIGLLISRMIKGLVKHRLGFDFETWIEGPSDNHDTPAPSSTSAESPTPQSPSAEIPSESPPSTVATAPVPERKPEPPGEDVK